MPTYLSLDDMPGKELLPGLTGRMVHTDTMTVMHVHIQAGTHMPEHHHPHEQISNVLQGELEFTINGETRKMGPGDIVFIHSNEPHSVDALTDVYVIDVFQPARDDYRDRPAP